MDLEREYLSGRVHHDLSAFDRLPITEGDHRDRLRRAVLFASLRWHRGHDREQKAARETRFGLAVGVVPIAVLGSVGYFFGRLAPIPGGTTLVIGSTRPGGTAIFIGSTRPAFIAIGVLAGLLLLGAVHWYGRKFMAYSAVSPSVAELALPAISIAIAVPVAPAIRGIAERSFLSGWFGACVIALFWLLSDVVAVAWARWRAAAHCKPFDALLVGAVILTARLHTESRGRLKPNQVREACRDVEELARKAHRAMTARGRAPRAVRRVLRQDGLRLAAVFRTHQAAISTAYSPSDLDRVVASLVSGIEAMASGDREALLANAPADIPVVRRLKAAIDRTWPAAVVIASGVLLPFIPAVARQPVLAGSLRWTLIVAGALTLVAGKDVAGQVGRQLDKAMPWKGPS